MIILNEEEMQLVNGGGINLDVNKLIDQLNPLKWCYDFGHDVIYPYIYKPFLNNSDLYTEGQI